MHSKTLLKSSFMLLLGALLTACGGGGGGGDALSPGTGGGGTTPTTPDPVPTIVLSLVDGAGQAVSEISGTETVTMRAVVRNADEQLVNGVVVTFAADLGQLNPAVGTALTGANNAGDGVAVLQLGAGTTAGAGTALASATVGTVATESNRVGFQTDGLGSGGGSVQFSISAVSLTTPDGSSNVSRANPGTLTVVVTDANGDGARGLVQFSASNGVLADPDSGAVFSDATTGIATITLLAGTNAGAGSANASVTINSEQLQSTPATFVSEGDSRPSVVLSLAAGGQTTTVSGTQAQTVTAVVRDDRGALRQGVIVSFGLTGSGAELSTVQDITNVSGIATTVLTASSGTGFGSVTASAAVDGTTVSVPASGVISFASEGDGIFEGEGSSNLGIRLVLDTDGNFATTESSIDAANPAILQATVTDRNGTGVGGVVVRFTTELGDLFPSNGLALTNSQGIATVTLNAGSVPGAGVAAAAIVFQGATFDSDSLTFETEGNGGDTAINLTLTFNDATPGNASNIITESQGAQVVVLVEDGGGTNLPNRAASVTTTLGTISVGGSAPATSLVTASGSDGRILIDLAAGTTLGTGDFVVTVGDTTETVQFEVGVADLRIGRCEEFSSPLDCGVGETYTEGALAIIVDEDATSAVPLSAGGTAQVGVVVTRGDGTPIEGIEIGFSSNCANETDPDTNLPLATITASVNSLNNGVAQATYQAQGCVGPDIITATETNSGDTASGTITVLSPVIGSIRFDSVVVDVNDPNLQSIQIKESGGITTAQVIFQVLDVFGNPARDETVSFQLTSNAGGMSLQGEDGVTGIATALTDEEGKARAFVQSGFLPTTVRVRASLEVDTDNDQVNDTTLVTLSGVLTVNTGIPDQNSMTIATTSFALEGDQFVGETAGITVRMADAFNNPVPDGTPISFETELGAIEGSCVTVDGACSVTLTTQNPRAPNDPNVSFNTLFNSSCPSPLVDEETVAITGTDGDTAYLVSVIYRVETAADGALAFGADYTVDADGSGITCEAGSVLCTDGANLKVTYIRALLDEDADDGTAHGISNPGVATAPFVQRSFAPCLAGFRSRSATAAGYFSGLGQRYGARSTVIARSLGEESFIDTNGNGLYDLGEPFVDLPEAFLDKNEDGVFGNGDPAIDDSRDVANPECYGPDSPNTFPNQTLDRCYQVGGEEERPYDFGVPGNPDKAANLRYDAGNRIYNGTLCPLAASNSTDTCDNTTADVCDDDGDTNDPNGDGLPEQFCTRDLVEIRRDITILFSGSDAFFSLRDSSTGEFVSAVDLRLAIAGGPGAGNFFASSTVTANNGGLIAPGTAFTIGIGDSQVPFGVGETTSLTTGNGSVVIDISDRYNGFLPGGTSVSVSSGTDGCVIQNSPGGAITDNSNFGFTRRFIALSGATSPPTGGAPITVGVTTPKNVPSEYVFNCSY